MMKKYLNVKEVCDLTGLAKGTIYQYTCQGLIPFVKMGRLNRFERVRIEEWMEELIQKSN